MNPGGRKIVNVRLGFSGCHLVWGWVKVPKKEKEKKKKLCWNCRTILFQTVQPKRWLPSVTKCHQLYSKFRFKSSTNVTKINNSHLQNLFLIYNDDFNCGLTEGSVSVHKSCSQHSTLFCQTQRDSKKKKSAISHISCFGKVHIQAWAKPHHAQLFLPVSGLKKRKTTA